MDLVRLFLKRIAYNQSQSDSFTLIMHELESDLKLPIIIGAFEAQSIALELEKRKIIPPKPYKTGNNKSLRNLLFILSST